MFVNARQRRAHRALGSAGWARVHGANSLELCVCVRVGALRVACSLADAELVAAFVSCALLELRHLRPEFVVEVIRSPDGTHSVLCPLCSASPVFCASGSRGGLAS